MSVNVPINSIKGTARVLRSQHINISPIMGLLAYGNPHLVSNLRTFPPHISPSSDMARLLFYQRQDSTGRTLGTVASSKSRSNVAFWLTPSNIGHLLGLAMSEKSVEGRLTSQSIDSELKSMGILCNTVNGNWSGISLERYRRIIHLIADDLRRSNELHLNDTTTVGLGYCVGYSVPLFLRLLWEKSTKKEDFLDFYLGFERGYQDNVIIDKYQDLRVVGTSTRSQWLDDNFRPHDLSVDSVNDSASRVLDWFEGKHHIADDDESDLIGHSMEIVTASLLHERACKPAIRLGRYSIDNGPQKPDCVEVCVREIVEALIFDPQSQSLRVDRLPTSAAASLKKLYEADGDNILSSFSKVVTSLSMSSKATSSGFIQVEKDAASNSFDAKLSSTRIIEGDPLGAAWFALCSQLSGCEYLSTNPTSTIAYELKPSLGNVVRALGHLLAEDPTWYQLEDLQTFWTKQNAFATDEEINVSKSMRSFRAALSDTEMVHREIASIKLSNRNHELILELEEAHGLAAVKHSRAESSIVVWDGSSVYQRFATVWEKQDEITSSLATITSRSFQRLCVGILMSEQMFRPNVQTVKASQRILYESVCAAPWGESSLYDPYVDRTGRLIVCDGALTMQNSANRQRDVAIRIVGTLDMLCSELSITVEDNIVLSSLEWFFDRCMSGDGIGNFIDVHEVAQALQRLPVNILRHPRFVLSVTKNKVVSNLLLALILDGNDLSSLCESAPIKIKDELLKLASSRGQLTISERARLWVFLAQRKLRMQAP